jgi:hypothetical protein
VPLFGLLHQGSIDTISVAASKNAPMATLSDALLMLNRFIKDICYHLSPKWEGGKPSVYAQTVIVRCSSKVFPML